MKQAKVPEVVSERPSVLILAESPAEADGIAATLGSEFSRIEIGRPDRAGVDVDRIKPEVIVFGFRSIREAEERHSKLQQSSKRWWEGVHSQIVLVHKDEVRDAYALCDRQIFDDYVLYWPQPYDALHLRLAVTQGARRARFVSQQVRLPQDFAQQLSGSRAAASAATNEATQVGTCLNRVASTLDADPQSARAWLETAERHLTELRSAVQSQAVAWDAIRGWAGAIKQRVLVVEDDPFQQHLLAHILETENFDVQLAASGADALASIRQSRPDLILCEFQLADTDGAALVRKLKTVPALHGVPIIIVTGHSNRAVVVDSIQAGAVDFLVKPLASDVVRQRIRTRIPALRDHDLTESSCSMSEAPHQSAPAAGGEGPTHARIAPNDRSRNLGGNQRERTGPNLIPHRATP